MKLNPHYQQLQESYLFSAVNRRVANFAQEHPDADIIRLGIGDVTLPLCPCVTQALHRAVDEMGEKETFRGYGPEQGYGFLREAIAGYYVSRGVPIDTEEVYVSDGAKSDLGNILDIFSTENTVWIPDPVYPVYVDTNTMDGKEIVYMNGTEENHFLPMPDESVKADIIYLCSPNNPTGACYNKE